MFKARSFVRTMRQQQEEGLAVIVGLCPWMTEEDVMLLRLVLAAHFDLVIGRDVDLNVMAEQVSTLAGRAEVARDGRRQWAFDQWYQWACAALRGEEWPMPDIPPELAVAS